MYCYNICYNYIIETIYAAAGLWAHKSFYEDELLWFPSRMHQAQNYSEEYQRIRLMRAS